MTKKGTSKIKGDCPRDETGAFDFMMDKSVELITQGLSKLNNGDAAEAVKDGFELFGGLLKIMKRDLCILKDYMKNQRGFLSGFWKGLAIFGAIGAAVSVFLIILKAFGVI